MMARVRRRDRRFDLARVDLERLEVAVDEHRQRVHQQDRVYRRDERVRRDDDFVAGSDAERREGRDEGAGAVGGGEATFAPISDAYASSNAATCSSAKPLAAAQDAQECILLARICDRPRGERRAPHGRRRPAAPARSVPPRASVPEMRWRALRRRRRCR